MFDSSCGLESEDSEFLYEIGLATFEASTARFCFKNEGSLKFWSGELAGVSSRSSILDEFEVVVWIVGNVIGNEKDPASMVGSISIM